MIQVLMQYGFMLKVTTILTIQVTKENGENGQGLRIVSQERSFVGFEQEWRRNRVVETTLLLMVCSSNVVVKYEI